VETVVNGKIDFVDVTQKEAVIASARPVIIVWAIYHRHSDGTNLYCWEIEACMCQSISQGGFMVE